MGKPKYDPPTSTYPYKIKHRYNILSIPKKYYIDTGDGLPAVSPNGVRISALRAQGSDRVNEVALPKLRRLLLIKKLYKNQFTPERLERIDRLIEAANATMYSKLANCAIDLKKQDNKELKKRKGWSEMEWRKHMDHFERMSIPRRDFTPPPVTRGPRKPLEELLPRINAMSQLPEFKIYKRLSQETWYRDPTKVPPNALKYVISDRVKKLAAHRVIQTIF